MKRPALIDGWRQSWRLNTMQAAAALALLSLAQAELLPLLKADIPSRLWGYVSFGFAAAIVLLRLRAQPGVLVPASPQDQPPGPPPPDPGSETETFRHPLEH